MERINENDVDCFLQQMEQMFAVQPKREKIQEEWRHFPGFIMWIPEAFQQADRETAEEIFWSENLPDILLLTEEKTVGITVQKLKDASIQWDEEAANPVDDIKQKLEKIDNRTVCYGTGEEGDGIKVYWLEYKSFASDSRIYNVLFVFRTGKEWNLGTFFCPFEEYEQWKTVVWEIMRTIKENIDEGI